MVDDVIKEPLNGAHRNQEEMFSIVKKEIKQYIKELEKIPAGRKHAKAYAEQIRKIFTALYDGEFVNGELEEHSVDGLYFYDVTFGNSAKTSFFQFLRNQGIKAGLTLFEAKNYDKTKIGNAQYNQASGYTILGGREIVFLVSRDSVDDKSIQRARRHFLSHKVLILPLSDKDIIEVLKGRKNNPEQFDIPLITRAKKIMEA